MYYLFLVLELEVSALCLASALMLTDTTSDGVIETLAAEP